MHIKASRRQKTLTLGTLCAYASPPTRTTSLDGLRRDAARASNTKHLCSEAATTERETPRIKWAIYGVY